jgi:anti-sigma regulatory factor (Ser/Thr protein kinase)
MAKADKRRNFTKNYNSYIEENTIKLGNLTNQSLVPEFIRSMNKLIIKFQHKLIIIDCEEVNKVYPIPTVPIVGLINYFKKNSGISFKYKNPSSYLNYIDFNNPKQISDVNIGKTTNTLDKIWKFSNSSEIHQLVTSYITCIRRTIICKEGVLNGCIWAMNEVMDNVIQHAGIETGFIMAQLDKKNSHLNVCIFDYGQGIYMTLKDTEHKPKTAVDAITLAITEGVTRDKKIGQGNGLWGLYNIVSQNDGKLSIISGKGGLLISDHGKISRTCNEMVILNKYNQCTTISFHVNLDKEISMKEVS